MNYTTRDGVKYICKRPIIEWRVNGNFISGHMLGRDKPSDEGCEVAILVAKLLIHGNLSISDHDLLDKKIIKYCECVPQ